MADVVIGRLSLKVYPDTSDFRRDVKKAADRIEKTLDPIKLQVELDDKEALKQARSTKQYLERQLEDVPVTVSLDGEQAETEAKSTYERMKASLKDLTTKITVNGRQASIDVEKAMAMMQEQIEDLTVHLDVALDNLDAMRAEIEAATQAATVKVKTEVDEPSLIKTITQINTALKTKLKKVGIQIDPVKDPFTAIARSTGLRLLWQMHRTKFEAFANFDKIAMQVGKLGLAFQALGGVLTATAGSLLSWGRDLGSIVAIALPLPGILTGIGLAAWNMKVAFSDAGKYLPKFKDQWEALQSAMSKNFWAKAQKPMQHMIDRLFPKFEKGMKRVSTELGGFTAALAKGLTKSFDPRLNDMMDNLARSIKIASKGAADLANGLAILVDFGMKQLPELAESFNDLTMDFNTFMETSEKNGNLQRWTSTAVTNLKALGSVLWNTVSVLGSLGAAAANAGASTLSSLAKTMERAAEVVRSGPFQDALTSFLQDVYSFTGNIGDALGRAISNIATKLGPMFGESLKALGPVLANAIDALFNGLTSPASVGNFANFFAGLKNGVANLQPAFEVLGEKVTAVLSMIGVAFQNLSLIVNAFVTELAVIIAKVQKPAEGLFNALGPSMAGNLEAIKPAIDGLAEAFETVLNKLQPVAVAMGSFKSFIEPMAEVMGNVFKAIANYLSQVFDTLAENLPQLATSLGQLASKFSFLSQFLPPLGSLFGTVFSLIVDIVISTVKTLIDGINNVIEGITNIFIGLITFFKGVFTGDLSMVWEGIKLMLLGVWQAILGAFQIWISVTMIGALRTGLFKIIGLWKSGWKTVQTAAIAVWNWIKGGAAGFTASLQTAIGNGITRVKTLWSEGWTGVKAAFSQAGAAIMKGVRQFASYISTKLGEVKTKAGEIATALPRLFREKAAEFVAIGASLIEGLKQGIIGKAEEAYAAVSEVAGKVANVVKSIWEINSPSKLFRRIAAGIPEGVAQGIHRNTKTAVSAAEDMAKAVAGVPMELSDVAVPSLGSLKTATLGAMDVGGAYGPGTTINQTFNQANVDAEESYRLLRFAVQTAKMSLRYGEAV